MINDLMKQSILEELVTEYRTRYRQPGDFTARDFFEQVGDHFGCIESARLFLETKVKMGLLEKRSVRDNGHATVVYRRK